MAKTQEPRNPFYLLVLLLGIVFLLTAVGYAVMAYRANAPAANVGRTEPHELMVFLDRYGLPLMVGELLLLGVATGGVMWLDQRQALRSSREETSNPDDAEPGRKNQVG